MVSSRVIICSESSVHVMRGVVITSVLMYFKRPPVAIRAYKNQYCRGNHAFLLKWIDHIILGSSVFAVSAQMERVTNAAVHSTPLGEDKHEGINTKQTLWRNNLYLRPFLFYYCHQSDSAYIYILN